MDSKGFNLPPEKLAELLNILGERLGTDPQKLKTQIDSGKFDGLMQNLSARQTEQFNTIISNPALLEQLLKNPNARKLLGELLGGV